MGCTNSKALPTDDDPPPLSGPRSIRPLSVNVSVNVSAPVHHHSSPRSFATFPLSLDNPRARITVFGTTHSPTIIVHPPSSCGHGGSVPPSPHTSLLPPARDGSGGGGFSSTLAMLLAPKLALPEDRAPPVLDMACYPHILDAILNYASRDALLAFRAASRSCMDAADKRLFRHIVFDDADPARKAAISSSQPLAWPGDTPPERLLVLDPAGHRLPCPPPPSSPPHTLAAAAARRAQQLAHTRVLDYHCIFDVDTVDPTMADALSGLEVVRRIWPSDKVLPAPTVVDYVDLSIAGYWTAAPCHPDLVPTPTVYSVPSGVSRVVVNIIYPTVLGDGLPHFDFGDMYGADIVLKFIPRLAAEAACPPRSPEYDMMRIAPLTVLMNGPKPFGFLGGLLSTLATQLQTSTVTVLSAEDVPIQLLGAPAAFPADQLPCMLAMGVAMCHHMRFVPGHGWEYASRDISTAAWRSLHRLHFTSPQEYTREWATVWCPPDGDDELLDVTPGFAGPVGALWVPSTGAPSPANAVALDLGPAPERFENETVRAIVHWRKGFEDGQFGNGCWGERDEHSGDADDSYAATTPEGTPPPLSP